jgi:phosphoglycerate dehydrogenase-like enzyme
VTDGTQTTAAKIQTTNQEHYDNNSPPQFNKVLVIGLGQLGLPVAKYVKERGFDTYGYDIRPKAAEMAQRLKKLLILVNLMSLSYVSLLIKQMICFHLK